MRRRSFSFLWVAGAFSQLGTSVSSLAYPLLLLDLTGSALQAGLVATVTTATGLLARLPGGAIADRVPRRRLLLTTDAARALVVAGVAAAVLSGTASAPLVLVIVAVEVALGAVFGPAEFAAVRASVAEEERALAVGRLQSRSQLAGLAGPLIGGALYAVHPALPFAVDAGSYLVSFVLLVLAGIRGGGAASGERLDLRAGWRWLRESRFFVPAGVWVGGLTAVFAAVGFAILVFARDRGATPAELGVMFAISTAGGVVGALLTPTLQRRMRPLAVFRAAAVVDVLATLALLPLESPYAIGVAGAAAFFLAPAVAASLFGELSRRAPDELVGRAQASLGFVVGAVAPFASAGAGLLIDWQGSTVAIGGCAAAFGVLAVTAWLLPRPDAG